MHEQVGLERRYRSETSSATKAGVYRAGTWKGVFFHQGAEVGGVLTWGAGEDIGEIVRVRGFLIVKEW